MLNITSYKSLSPRVLAGVLLQPEWSDHRSFPAVAILGSDHIAQPKNSTKGGVRKEPAVTEI